MPNILNGKAIAAKRLAWLAQEIEVIKKSGESLTLASILVGEPPDAVMYSRAIEKLMVKVGAGYLPKKFPENISENQLLQEISKLNQDARVTGILIFTPLPKCLDAARIRQTVNTSKNIEAGRQGTPTAVAAMMLIEETGVDLCGKEAVVIGRSESVGRSAAMLLLDKHATVTVCHSQTKNLAERARAADILVVAVGKPALVKGDWIKSGAVVIDVGENSVNGQVVGDVEFESASKRAGFISPVPGGVGPVTHAALVQNLIALHKIKKGCHGNS